MSVLYEKIYFFSDSVLLCRIDQSSGFLGLLKDEIFVRFEDNATGKPKKFIAQGLEEKQSLFLQKRSFTK